MKRGGPAARAAGFALVAALLCPSLSAGAPLEGVEHQAATLESLLAQVEKTYTRPDETVAARARRQFSDGEIQYLLGDWLFASVLMYGALDEPGFRASDDGARALLYLGDSLRSQGSWGAALAAYDELLRRGAPALEAQAVTGALACRVKLKQFDGIDPLLQAARRQIKDGRPAELAYLVGKATAFRPDLRPAERLEQGLADFASVAAPRHLAAAYFQGALLVDAGQLEAAAARFEACLALQATDAGQVEIRELCAMAAARVYAELGKFPLSLDRYQLIPHTSSRFDEALFEVAWGYIRAGRLDQALLTASIIVDLAPGSRLAPEATILTGHLQLRLGQFAAADQAFQKVVDTYAPVRDELDKILQAPEDPVRHFNELIARQGMAFDVASVLPPLAVTWASSQQEVGGALEELTAIEAIRQDLTDSANVLTRIEGVLERSNGLDGVPLARDGWINADAVENGSLWLRGQLADRAAELVAPRLAPERRAELERLRAARRELQAQIDSLPRSTAEVEARAARMKARVDRAGKDVFQLGRQADSAGAAVGGTEAWLHLHSAEVEANPTWPAELSAELQTHREVISGYQETLRRLRQELAEAKDGVGGTFQAAGDVAVRGEYRALLDRERALLDGARPALAPAEADELRRQDALVERLDRADAGAERLKARFAETGARSAVELRRRIAAERADIQRQQEQLASVTGDAKDILGRIALRSFGAVRAQLQRLVLKADVGILDVAWSRKRERVEKIQKLSQQKDAALQALDKELKRVLREVE